MTTYSFLSQELNTQLGIVADVIIADDECHEITLTQGDHVIAATIDPLTLIGLFQMGVKVSLLETELTENQKAGLMYSLVLD